MSRKCPNCAADVLENAKFCIKCGTKMPPNVTLGSTPTPFANRIPPPVSSSSNSSSAGAVFVSPPPVAPSVPKKEEVSFAEVQANQTSRVDTAIKTDAVKPGSNKGIIFGVIGVFIAAIGGFLLTSSKDEPPKSVNAPVISAPPVPAPSPTIAAPPPKPSAPIAPPPAVAPAAIAPKPAQPPPPATLPAPAPTPAPAPAVPDVNKLMRDAANK